MVDWVSFRFFVTFIIENEMCSIHFVEEEQNLSKKDKEFAKGFESMMCDDLTITKSIFFDMAT